MAMWSSSTWNWRKHLTRSITKGYCGNLKEKQNTELKEGLLKWMVDFLKDREMRTILRDKETIWKSVSGGVQLGSVLAPIILVVYVNDISENIDSYITLFAYDTKLMRRIKRKEDCEVLQWNLDKIVEWSHTWEMKFNTKKRRQIRIRDEQKGPKGSLFNGEWKN